MFKISEFLKLENVKFQNFENPKIQCLKVWLIIKFLQSLVLQSTKNMKIDKEWTPIKFDLTIRPVNELESSDVHCLQIYNILFRKCLSLLKLQEIGRIYCDSSKAIELRHHNLHIWPGFLSSTRNHENGLLLNVEICHKVMRQDTALHIIKSVAGPEKQDFSSEDLQTVRL